MTIDEYKKDESKVVCVTTMTESKIARANGFANSFLNLAIQDYADFIDAINYYGANGTCLDMGACTGQQYFSMKEHCPTVVWSGVELLSCCWISEWFAGLLDSDENPTLFFIDTYLDLSQFKDNSYDVVTSRSLLTHYFTENGFKIIEDMFRICKKAVIIKFYAYPEQDTDTYWEHPRSGYVVDWAYPKWTEFVSSLGCTEIKFGSNTVALVKPE